MSVLHYYCWIASSYSPQDLKLCTLFLFLFHFQITVIIQCVPGESDQPPPCESIPKMMKKYKGRGT